MSLNKQSAGLLGKTCLIVNLFLVVHETQHIAENPSQNNRLFWPMRLLEIKRRSTKEDGDQLTANQDLM